MNRYALFASLILVVTGCDKEAQKSAGIASQPSATNSQASPVATPSLEQNPVQHFKAFVTRVEKEIRSTLLPPKFDSTSIDVRKTDSLVSPYVGTLKFQRISKSDTDPNIEFWYDYTLAFVAQDGRWEYKSISTEFWHVDRKSKEKTELDISTDEETREVLIKSAISASRGQ